VAERIGWLVEEHLEDWSDQALQEVDDALPSPPPESEPAVCTILMPGGALRNALPGHAALEAVMHGLAARTKRELEEAFPESKFKTGWVLETHRPGVASSSTDPDPDVESQHAFVLWGQEEPDHVGTGRYQPIRVRVQGSLDEVLLMGP
jgi:hypothetical protein